MPLWFRKHVTQMYIVSLGDFVTLKHVCTGFFTSYLHRNHAWSMTFCACLPFTPPRHCRFVMSALLCALSNKKRTARWDKHICMYLCPEVGVWIPTFDFLNKKLKVLSLYGDRRWERWNFSRVHLFLHHRLIPVWENCEWKWRISRTLAHFMTILWYAFLWMKWQISVQSCIIL